MSRYRERVRLIGHRLRKTRTWTDCTQATIVKMRYRHAHEFTETPPLQGWHSLIGAQLHKFGNKIDEVNAWQRREFFVLEKMNAGVFKQDRSFLYGFTWTFAANMQISKVNRLHIAPRRYETSKTWGRVILRRNARKDASIHDRDMMSLAAVRKAVDIASRQDWHRVMYSGWRRSRLR